MNTRSCYGSTKNLVYTPPATYKANPTQQTASTSNLFAIVLVVAPLKMQYLFVAVTVLTVVQAQYVPPYGSHVGPFGHTIGPFANNFGPTLAPAVGPYGPTVRPFLPTAYKGQYNYYNPTIPILAYSNDQKVDGSYSFSFATADGKQVQENGYLKGAYLNTDGEPEGVHVVQGSYSYTSPDGTPVQVNYVADENGFQPQGVHIPADGKYTPPSAIPAAVPAQAVSAAATGTVEASKYYPYKDGRYNQYRYNQYDKYRYNPYHQDPYYRFNQYNAPYNPYTPYNYLANTLPVAQQQPTAQKE